MEKYNDVVETEEVKFPLSQRIKNHFRKHKTTYLVVGSVVATAAITYVISAKVNATQIAIGKDITQLQITEVHLARRGHPGNVIQCNETGELFASQNRAAELLGLNRRNLGKHLSGELPDIDNLTFTKLGEAS